MSADTASNVVVPEMPVPLRFTVDQFDRMVAAGLLPEEEGRRMRLYRGEIQHMTPPNPPHDDVISQLTEWAFRSQPEVAVPYQVRVQLSMDLRDQSSVLSPDLLLVEPRSYARRRPVAGDTYLLVEAADSSLSHDLSDKVGLYAEAGVREYWVVDIPHRRVIVHTDPADGRYRTVQTFDEHLPVEATVLSGLKLRPSSLFR